MSEKTEEQQALEAAELHTLSIQVDLSRNDLMRGQFGEGTYEELEEEAREDEDFAKMEFTKDGHLIAGIHESHVVSYDPPTEDEKGMWHVATTCYSGSLVFDEEYWRVYRANDGKWIVEGE